MKTTRNPFPIVMLIAMALTQCLGASPAPEGATYSEALARAAKCDTPTFWAEHVKGWGYIAVCGDAEGNEIGDRE